MPNSDAVPHPAASPLIDRQAVMRGAACALAIAIPAGFAQRLTGEGSSVKGLLFAVILIGFGWGGAVAAKAGTGHRGLTHGTLAGVVAVAVYLLIGMIARASDTTSTSTTAIKLSFTAMLCVSCAIVGAELSERRRRRASAETIEVDDRPNDHEIDPLQ